MINLSLTGLIALTVSFFTVFGFANYYPLFENDNLGATVTTLNSGDSLVDFPTTYNANINAINTDLEALEATTTMSLLTGVGTITSGTWTATDVGVAYGGTGTSTVTVGAVIYGNGTSGFESVGPCTDNQVLQYTSSVPLCATFAVDQADDYTWTGEHTFTTATATNATSTDHNFTNIPTYGANNINLALTASSTTFASSGTYTKSTGVVKVFVQVWAGGGGGGSTSACSNCYAGGGGGGGYVSGWFDASELGATETITVGAGGAASSAGYASYFGALITAYGGGGGGDVDGSPQYGASGGGGGAFATGTSASGGTAGVTYGAYGTISAGGGQGTAGASADSSKTMNSVYGGGAGAYGYANACNSFFNAAGTSNLGGDGGAIGYAATGGAGNVPAGGGGGACETFAGSDTHSGGAGGDGQVIVTEFF